jgi:membrane fusion protein, multidrug efflux system
MKPVTLFLASVLVIGGAGVWAWQNKPELVAPIVSSVPGLEKLLPALPTRTAGAAPSRTDAGGGASGRRNNGGAPVSVVTAPVEQSDFAIRRRSIGYVEPMATVVVKSRTDSQLLEQHVTDGQMVKAGDLLFTLDDKELAAQLARDEANLSRDQAVRDRTEADLKRKRELLSNNSGAQQQVDQAISDAKSAAATIAADEAAIAGDKLRLSYTKITAPITGRAGTVQVTPGNLVRSNDTGNGLVTITQVKPLRVAFTLPERELTRIRTAMSTNQALPVRLFASATDKLLATSAVSFIDSSVDTASGTITVKAIFPNDDMTLWPGQYVDVAVDLEVVPNAAVIPTVALQTGQDSSYVFVIKPDKTTEIRKVAVLASNGDRTAIQSGLRPGEKVVVDGMMRLNNGARVREAGDPPAKPGRADPAQASGQPAPDAAQPKSGAAKPLQAKPVAENEVRS